MNISQKNKTYIVVQNNLQMDSSGISVIQRAKPFLMDNLDVDETFLNIFWSNELLTSPDVYRILRAVCTTCGGLRNYRMKYIRWFTRIYMMTTWQRDDVRITGPLWGLSTSHQWITLTKCRKRGTLIFVSCFSLKSCWVIRYIDGDSATSL